MSTSQTEFPESVEIKPVPSWQIKLLYDGECPLCVREVNFLKKRDGGRGLVAFVDIQVEKIVLDAETGFFYQNIASKPLTLEKPGFFGLARFSTISNPQSSIVKLS